MGIPSFFSHIVKKHSECIKQIDNKFIIDYLFLDANSIIYDSMYKLLKNTNNPDNMTKNIIEATIQKIQEYITSLNPQQLCYVAFDGNPPVAKLQQQRNRRYQSKMNDTIANIINETEITKWDSAQITPGTLFMNSLMNSIRNHKFICHLDCKFYLSDSNQPGEGEHKIFDYIRLNKNSISNESNIIIYGLDADLIMLSLNHLYLSDNIFLFRETPHFISQINSDLKPDELYSINIYELGNNIYRHMKTYTETHENKQQTIKDYIFLTLILGNDFIPHSPSVNIRKNGIDLLLDTYKQLFGTNTKTLISNNKVQWNSVRKILISLANNELDRIKQEHKERDKYSNRTIQTKTCEEKLKKFELLPSYSRDTENYINPFEKGWQHRYYKKLCDIDSENSIRLMCINYFEALEWTYEYYSIGCKDWRWSYKYAYAPLLSDMIKYVSYFNVDYLSHKNKTPINTNVQLAYVLPKESINLIPKQLQQFLLKEFAELYNNHNIEWCYCKYMWEAKVKFPEIDLELFENKILNLNLQN